jgi:hypothetical protein
MREREPSVISRLHSSLLNSPKCRPSGSACCDLATAARTPMPSSKNCVTQQPVGRPMIRSATRGFVMSGVCDRAASAFYWQKNSSTN